MKRALAPVDTNRDDRGGTSGARVAGAAFDGRHYADGGMVWIVARDVGSVAALAGRAGFLAATWQCRSQTLQWDLPVGN